MDLEFQQLDLRYESLRIRSARRERKLLASISAAGQLVPIATVAGDCEERRVYIVVDGFARVRVLRQLRQDTVRTIQWDVSEVEALLIIASSTSSAGASILEQAWLLVELRRRFGLDQEELARRFDHSQSWISRRLALVQELPDSVQEEIRNGRIGPHAASKYLVPMARANRDQCERMARAIAKDELPNRDIGELYSFWRDGDLDARERLIDDPSMFLRVRRSLVEPTGEDTLGTREAILKEIALIGYAARRARERVKSSSNELGPIDHRDVLTGLDLAASEIRLAAKVVRESQEQGEINARSEHANDDPRVK